ncbi:MAG: TetR-like C-terminal domain-containing protein, partial [Actinomycetota bacterium]
REVQLKMEENALAILTRIFDAAVERGQLPAGLEPKREAAHLMGPMVFNALVIREVVDHDLVVRIVDNWLAGITHP